MSNTFKIKSKPSNDNFKKNVYLFDTILEVAINAFISTMNTEEMKKSNPANDKFNLYQIKDSIELTKKILEIENIQNFFVDLNNSKRTSSCYYNKILFCENHLNNQEVAFHEMAHFFEGVFTVNHLPGHHVSFLATLEYLLDKYHFLNKTLFRNMVKHYEFLTNNKLPYIQDFFTITEHNLSEYDSILNSYLEEEKYNGFKSDKYFINGNFESIIFESHDHYINLLVNKNNKTVFQKIIQKKLDFEIKNKKHYDVIISPKFMSFREYGVIKFTQNKTYYTHDSIAISIESENIDAYQLIDLIEKNLVLTKNHLFSIQNVNNKSIVLGINADLNNGDTVLIKLINSILKKHHISYYNTKSKKEFSDKSTKLNYYLL